ncbi:hypothetical protein Ddye_000964 [Dipteronia dyeriana]|uniref:Phospholipase-like protein n=1 Tax=Dipteronia dyeriana TaxID=168575 RepID=A0AAD9XNB7_9ROSI|nr:hypothetical protein Ddye_000964 [Dipteronia dyeriana]
MRNRLRDLLKTPEGDWCEGKLTRHNHFDALAHIDDVLNRVPTEFADEDRRLCMTSCFGHFLTMHREMNFLGDTTKYASVENGIHQWYFPAADEVSLEEIRGVVTVVEFGEVYDAVKLCLIYMLNWILMGVDERFKIPVWQFRLVEDLDVFDAFPWDAHVYMHSIYSFKHAVDGRRDGFERCQQEKGTDVHNVETYNIYGLSHALLVISDLGKKFGARMVTDLTPRILKWELTKQPRGKKLAKIFKARTTFGGNSDTKGKGLTDRTSDNEGSELASGGLRPSDSEGYETDPQRERHMHMGVRFTTPGHGTSTGDSRWGVGCDGEVPWADLLNDVREALRKSNEDRQRQHLELVDMI